MQSSSANVVEVYNMPRSTSLVLNSVKLQLKPSRPKHCTCRNLAFLSAWTDAGTSVASSMCFTEALAIRKLFYFLVSVPCFPCSHYILGNLATSFWK